MIKATRTKSAFFVCTPELVSSWLFYPAWLCMPNLCPRALVMDFSDLERRRKDAKSINVTPYDVITWETLKTYLDYGFLISHDPLYNKPLKSGYVPLRYSERISKKELGELKTIAGRMTNSLSKEQLHKIVQHGYKSWKHFGLELRKILKDNDPIFSYAIERTNIELSEIERGIMPIDPKALVRRHLLKLLVGLRIRSVYSKMARIPESDIRVFDTPEYNPAAELLVKNLNLSPACFAIPTDTPEKNESFIREILNLEDSNVPLCSQDLVLLHDAVEEIKELFDSGGSEIEIKRQISSQVEEACHKVKRKDIISLLPFAGVNFPTWSQVAKALTGSTPDSIAPFIVSLLSILYVIFEGENILKGAISNYPSSVKFIVTREMFYNCNPVLNIKKTWLRHLLSLARKFKPRPATEEYIWREMKKPWVENPVWYDP